MPHRDLGRSYRLAVAVVRPLLVLLTRRRWCGAQHLPARGGFVVCSNHLSHSDPLTLGHYLLDHGHPPYFLAKESLFTIPLIGRVIRGAGQIPVHRETSDAVTALTSAVAAVEQGKCIVLYPEGTLTRDPDLWPMVGKSGAARLALQTGCPLVPVAQWGPQVLMSPHSKRLRLLPRPLIQVVAGPPVDLDDLRGRPVDAPLLAEATERIMTAVTDLLRPLRDGTPPQQRLDWHAARGALRRGPTRGRGSRR